MYDLSEVRRIEKSVNTGFSELSYANDMFYSSNVVVPRSGMTALSTPDVSLSLFSYFVTSIYYCTLLLIFMPNNTMFAIDPTVSNCAFTNLIASARVMFCI